MGKPGGVVSETSSKADTEPRDGGKGKKSPRGNIKVSGWKTGRMRCSGSQGDPASVRIRCDLLG